VYAEGGFVPIAFSIWDGWSGDRGNRRSVTSWYHLYLEPARAESKLAPIAASGALVLLLEMGVIGAVRRRKGVPIPGFAAWSSGMSRARSLNVDLGFSLLGGLVGTIAMTIFLYLVLPTLDQRPLDIAALVGEVFDVGWAVGVLTHIVLGALVFPLLFVVFIYPALPGPAWFKGLLWGCFLWIVAEIVAVPIAHGGLFHAAAGGARAAFGFLAGHALYGVVLGAVAGSSGPDD
jgi:hypothetical protein